MQHRPHAVLTPERPVLFGKFAALTVSLAAFMCSRFANRWVGSVNIAAVNIPDHQLRDAARLAVQSAAAAAVTFVVMQSLDLPEKFVAVLSSVLVVQPSVGNTLGEASDRIVATLVGCVVGLVCLTILPSGYGTAAALALAMLVMNAIAGLRPAWRYGVVAAVALALGSDGDLFNTAMDRSIGIALGSALGALASFLVWPDRDEKRARRNLRSALKWVARLLDTAVDDARSGDKKLDRESPRHFHAHLSEARQAAEGIKFGDSNSIAHDIRHIDRLYDSVLIVVRVAEESDQVAADDEDLDNIVESLRTRLCEIVRELSDGNTSVSSDHLDSIAKEIEQATDRVLHGKASDMQRLRQNALVFGLKEVLEQLRALIDGPDEEPDDSDS